MRPARVASESLSGPCGRGPRRKLIQWYSMPALMKLWLDEVLAHGWAYGEGGCALAGKCLWLVASTGGAEASYRAGDGAPGFERFLPAYRETAAMTAEPMAMPLVSALVVLPTASRSASICRARL